MMNKIGISISLILSCSLGYANEIKGMNWILIDATVKSKESQIFYIDKHSIVNVDKDTRYVLSKLLMADPDVTTYMRNLYNCQSREKLSLETQFVFNKPNQKNLSAKAPNNDVIWEYVPKGEGLAQKAFEYVCK